MTIVFILGTACSAGLSLRRRGALGVVLMMMLSVFMVAGALPAADGNQLSVFRTPVFVTGMVLLCALIAGCVCRLRRFRLGFVCCHVGVVVALGGAFAGFIFGVKTQFAAPIAMEHGISRLPGPDDTTYDLPFALSVLDFEVDFYQPDYHLYDPPEYGGDYLFDRTVSLPSSGHIDLGQGDRLEVSDLRDEEGDWKRQIVLPSGRLLQMGEGMPKHYEATLKLDPVDGTSRTETLMVNHPVSQDGWRFYLMSYDREARRYVVMSARRDPGRPWVIAGLWMIIVGTAWICWLPRRNSAGQHPDPRTAPAEIHESSRPVGEPMLFGHDAPTATGGGEA